MNIASNILSINKIITLKNKKMNKDYSFLNPESGIVPETRDFTPDYAPQMPSSNDGNYPTPGSYDFTNDYAPAPPTPDKE
ncbi:MAG: hypothetical protein MR650_13025 [Bacteroides uniformis]|nr:hypothetical protein [Bacteroides uniformis]